MTNFKKVLIVLLMAVLMISVSNIVLATEDDENITFIEDEDPNSVTNGKNNTNTTNNTNNTNNTNTTNKTNNTNKTNTNSSSKYNNTNLPKAGSSDGITVMVVVAVFGILAIYAYKKIRDYNIK